MKRFLILLLLLAGLSVNAQSNIITATVTVTNMPTNGYTFSVNGNLRTWTNNVTSANNQIPTYQTVGTNIVGLSNYLQFATNLWIAYITYPETAVRSIQLISSNIIQLQSYPGQALTIATNGEPINWVTWSFTTNHTTNETVFRYPTNGLGVIEQSNASTALIGFLNSTFVTNAIISTLPQWSNFVNATSLAALSNYVGLVATNATNFTKLCGTSATNYINSVGLLLTNYSSNLVYGLTNVSSGTVYLALQYFTNQFGLLQNNVNYHDLGNLTGNTNTILLTNEGGIKRYVANANGRAVGGKSSWYESDGGTLFMEDDLQNGGQFQIWDERGSGATSRLEIDNTSRASGPTWLRGPNGFDTFKIMPLTDTVHHFHAITFLQSTWPAVSIGTVTNFFVDATNIGAGETAVNSFLMPAYAMTNTGDCLTRNIGLTFTASGSYDVKIYFAGSTIYDSGNFTAGASSCLTVNSDTTLDAFSGGLTGGIRYACSANGSLVTNLISATVNKASSIDFSSTQTLKVGITGPANANIHLVTDTVRFNPSPTWAQLP